MEILDFKDIRNDEDIKAFAKKLNPDNRADFMAKTKEILLSALIGLIYYECANNKKNIETLTYYIESIEVRKYDSEFKSYVDLMFEEINAKSPNSFAAHQYEKFKKATGTVEEFVIKELQEEWKAISKRRVGMTRSGIPPCDIILASTTLEGADGKT